MTCVAMEYIFSIQLALLQKVSLVSAIEYLAIKLSSGKVKVIYTEGFKFQNEDLRGKAFMYSRSSAKDVTLKNYREMTWG